MPEIQLSPPRVPHDHLLPPEKIKHLDSKSRRLYDALMEQPASITQWSFTKWHGQAFGEDGFCSFDRSNFIDVIDVGRWLDVSHVKLYCM